MPAPTTARGSRSAEPLARTPGVEWAGPGVLGLLVGSAAVIWLSIGLGDAGFWTEAELPVVDRSRAALGESLSGLKRSPWLPDAVRTAFFSAVRSELGLRLPHALAVGALAGIVAGIVRARGGTVLHAALGGALLLCFPGTAIAGRTVLGNPLGELAAVVTVLTGIAATRAPRPTNRAAWGLAALASFGLSVSALGLGLGGAAPLLAIAAADGSAPRPFIPKALAAAAVATVAIVAWSSWGQGDGYIPLLGAAKELDLMDRPEGRRYAAGLEDFGYQVFPWVGLVVAGAVRPTARWPALWLASTLALTLAWSLVYGSTPVPAMVPAALCIVAAVQAIADPGAPPLLRRATVVVGIAAILVMRKDAELYPSRIAVPQHRFAGEHHFPAEPARATGTLRSMGSAVLVATLFAGLWARRRDEEGIVERVLCRIPARVRDEGSVAAFLVAAVVAGGPLLADLVDRVGALSSLRTPLHRYARWLDDGTLEEPLGMHRIRDPGVGLYGPARLEALPSRHDLFGFLQSPSPRAALVRVGDVPALHQHARAGGWSFFVLDDSHGQLRLVSNTLVPGAEDRNRIGEVLFDAPVDLTHETEVQFERYVKIVGWEVTEPLVRGRSGRLSLAIEVLRPLPGGSKLHARFLGGRLSKFNFEPVDFADNAYPCNLWRPGDFIVHTQTFEVPVLEVLPGIHDLVVGIRRSEHQNFDIVVPAETEGEFGVVVRDKKRNFAKIGEVQVW
jgi:hypothetical protein